MIPPIQQQDESRSHALKIDRIKKKKLRATISDTNDN